MRKFLVAAALAGLTSGCTREALAPSTQIYMLVDLSATWHNEVRAERNRQVLEETGFGVAMAAEELEPPLGVQVRPIGTASLEREPLCDVTFAPRLTRQKNRAVNEINRRPQLENYLGRDCPRMVLSRAQEQQTEISSAVESVANQPAVGNPRRVLIVLSDFLEDTGASVGLNSSLQGFEVLLLYRPITEDQANPGDMRARVIEWRRAMEARGATVAAMPDTALNRRTIAGYLLGEFSGGSN